MAGFLPIAAFRISSLRGTVLFASIAAALALPASASEDPSPDFSSEERSWWAIQPVSDPAVPATGKKWARNELDHFIARTHSANNLSPAPEASRHELLRRATFDLHGLPPTPEQSTVFLEDNRPGAWERLIDRLLASPRYGERWGQHWLDIVRYAESDGYRQDAFRPDAWPYRDYVIRSFNDDKPYDDFVREQIAGDEIAPGNPGVFIGTAFLRNGIYEYNQRNVRMHWELIVDELTGLTGEVFLGLGIGCAQCHDHKFDPLLQKDYLRLRAYLAPVRWRFDLSLATPAQIRTHKKNLATWKEATAKIRAGIDAIIEPKITAKQQASRAKFPEDIQELFAKPRNERTPYQQQLVELAEIQVRYERTRFSEAKGLKEEEKKQLEALRAALKEFDHLKPASLPTAFTATDIGSEAPRVVLHDRKGETNIAPGIPSIFDPAPANIPPSKRPNKTGRRLALANWITNPANPLSTRVIVNRLWQHHFGRGIVPTPNDFGTLGEKPSHPELLDWLTTRFLEDDWRLKPTHKRIMMSASYRQTAAREPTATESNLDPSNRLLWRFPPRRLDAEEIRDAMLLASGEITHRESGPSADGSKPVRSIYVKKIRNTPDAFLAGFDAPAGFASEPDRIATTTATQSLLVTNGEWTTTRAEAFARNLLREGSAPKHIPFLIDKAFRAAYGRQPSEQERRSATRFVQQQVSTPPETTPSTDPYVNETGFRPITEAFRMAKGISLGSNALWLQPGSRFERLHLEDFEWPNDEFTIEAVASLDNLHHDASVNTLFSSWNGDKNSPGWTFGVTSEKSRYDPRNFIMQLVGKDFQDSPVYEVVASGLRFPTATPVYFAVAVSARPSAEDATAGSVTFYMKDLSDPEARLQTTTVKHSVVHDLANAASRLLVGGRDQGGHHWDGQLARLALSAGALPRQQLLIGQNSAQAERLLDWTFEGEDGENPAPDVTWLRANPAGADPAKAAPEVIAAFTDLCHALLVSNEFLYLH